MITPSQYNSVRGRQYCWEEEVLFKVNESQDISQSNYIENINITQYVQNCFLVKGKFAGYTLQKMKRVSWMKV